MKLCMSSIFIIIALIFRMNHGKNTFKCVWDKISIGATDDWCQNNYKGTGQCRGSGCLRESYDSKDSPNVKISPPNYDVQNVRSGCCTRPETFHERCLCAADISFCQDACDKDVYCKGYFGEMGGLCHIATTSTCPHESCQRQDIGETRELSAKFTCGSKNFEGCYIKQKVDCEWSNWYLQKQYDKKCGSGFEVYRRKKILTESLRELGYTSCKGIDYYEDECAYPTNPVTSKTHSTSLISNSIIFQLGVKRSIPNKEIDSEENEIERSFDSDSISIYMAGAIGGVSLILLVVVLIAATIAKKKNIKQPSDTNEGIHLPEIDYEGYDEQGYDNADSRSYTNPNANNETMSLETIQNPYYDGNEYLIIHGKSRTQPETSVTVDTMKIVNNVYYE